MSILQVGRGIGYGFSICSVGPQTNPITEISIPSTYSPPVLPDLAGALVLQLESSDFDAYSSGSSIKTWNDKSSYGHHFTASSATEIPVADTVRTLNGHPTVRLWTESDGGIIHHFTASAGGKWADAFTQAEIYMVVKKDADLPASIYHAGAPIQIAGDGLGHYFPRWDDGYVWSNFGCNRRALNNPVTNLSGSSFVTYNLVVSQSLYSASINNELFYSSSAAYTPYFTDISAGSPTGGGGYWVGRTWSGGFPMAYQGNIAAIYFYNRKLTSGERTQVKSYINSTWGTSLV